MRSNLEFPRQHSLAHSHRFCQESGHNYPAPVSHELESLKVNTHLSFEGKYGWWPIVWSFHFKSKRPLFNELFLSLLLTKQKFCGAGNYPMCSQPWLWACCYTDTQLGCCTLVLRDYKHSIQRSWILHEYKELNWLDSHSNTSSNLSSFNKPVVSIATRQQCLLLASQFYPLYQLNSWLLLRF